MKFVIYYRVSTKKQGKSGLGLEGQKAIVNHYVNQQDIVQQFTEVASAKYMDCKNRPELCKAVELCKKNGYTLVVEKLDRLSRTTEHALSIYNDLDGRLQSLNIPNLDKFTLTLCMAMADREKELVSIRTKQALAELKKKGIKLGNTSNFTNEGRAKGRKVIARITATNKANVQAQELCNLYNDNGCTLREIANKLNSNGYKTSRGSTFQATTVKRLLERAYK